MNAKEIVLPDYFLTMTHKFRRVKKKNRVKERKKECRAEPGHAHV